MSRNDPPTPPPAMSGRAFLAALTSKPAVDPERGMVHVWTQHGWAPLQVLPKTRLRLVGEGMKLVIADYLPELSHKERVRLWEEESRLVHEQIRRGNEEMMRPASPPSAPDRSRVDHPPGQQPDTTERSVSERGSKSVSGVELSTPTSQEIAELGRKGGFRRSSKRFSR